jgi:hypothetical protein
MYRSCEIFNVYKHSIQNKLDQTCVVIMSKCYYSTRNSEMRDRGDSVNYNVCTTYCDDNPLQGPACHSS